MPFRALWAAYNRQLQRQPVLTQVSTSAVLWGAGDLLAQQIEKAGREHASYDAQVASPPPPGSSQAPSVLPLRQLPVPARNLAAEGGVDWRRSGMTGVFGGSVVGPIGHYWYIGIDKLCARLCTPHTPQFIAAKVVLDTATMGPFYVAAFFAFGCAFIDGGTWSDFKAKMKKDFWPTFGAEVAFWPVVQTVNFWRVPVQHQLLVVNMMTVLDAAFMSWARNQDDWLANVLRHINANKQAKST